MYHGPQVGFVGSSKWKVSILFLNIYLHTDLCLGEGEGSMALSEIKAGAPVADGCWGSSYDTLLNDIHVLYDVYVYFLDIYKNIIC